MYSATIKSAIRMRFQIIFLWYAERQVIAMNIVFETVIDPVTVMLIWALIQKKSPDQ